MQQSPPGRFRWFRVLLVYGICLLASHAVRAFRDAPSPAAIETAWGTDKSLEVRLAAGSQPVRISYRDSGQAPSGVGLPILLLHGSPGSKSDFDGLGLALGQGRRVIAVDLPGFGASEHELPDYSIEQHALYVARLAEGLGLDRFHVLGFSMGGGVAIELSGLEADRVASLTLLSAIGVQELELMGDYHLNHGIHGLQLGALWVLSELVPHFGLLDGGMLSLEYARNFYDSDQRPLRGLLLDWDGPCLILHGRRDVLVPFAAAEEHARLVPQAELESFDASHFMVFRDGESLAARIEPFLAAAEGPAAPARATADPARRAAAEVPFDPNSLAPISGLSLWLILFFVVIGTLVTEDLTCIAVGALVAQGRLEFLPGTLACFVGIYIGDLMLFVAGRLLGRRALGHWPLKRFLSEARVEHCSRWFQQKGPMVIFLSRFMPGMRLPTYFAAGVLRTGFLRFSGWFFLAAALWTPAPGWRPPRVGGGRWGGRCRVVVISMAEAVDEVRRILG